MKELILVLVIVAVLALVLAPTNANANPGNLQPLPAGKGTWPGQKGVASNGTAIFSSGLVGIKNSGVNALTLLHQGHTTYQSFGDAWSGSTAAYAQAIAQATGHQVEDNISAATPFGLASLLHGIYFAEASADPTNYVQRLVGSTWAFL